MNSYVLEMDKVVAISNQLCLMQDLVEIMPVLNVSDNAS